MLNVQLFTMQTERLCLPCQEEKRTGRAQMQQEKNLLTIIDYKFDAGYKRRRGQRSSVDPCAHGVACAPELGATRSRRGLESLME
ncbi:unnamed protein product [Caenorhabditis auriculariae]|uniref:Uncharacterized protein n=1 Tax=Caenorhabditis auriculariae TaxID=2777116 RepID=A0A8S1HL44_9PELO|nr:unnamed protein product [Caenorhabditis auriculariae]